MFDFANFVIQIWTKRKIIYYCVVFCFVTFGAYSLTIKEGWKSTLTIQELFRHDSKKLYPALLDRYSETPALVGGVRKFSLEANNAVLRIRSSSELLNIFLSVLKDPRTLLGFFEANRGKFKDIAEGSLLSASSELEAGLIVEQGDEPGSFTISWYSEVGNNSKEFLTSYVEFSEAIAKEVLTQELSEALMRKADSLEQSLSLKISEKSRDMRNQIELRRSALVLAELFPIKSREDQYLSSCESHGDEFNLALYACDPRILKREIEALELMLDRYESASTSSAEIESLRNADSTIRGQLFYVLTDASIGREINRWNMIVLIGLSLVIGVAIGVLTIAAAHGKVDSGDGRRQS